MNEENKITLTNLISALFFLAFGIILLTSTEDLISIASKVLGIIIGIVGIVKILLYVYRKGKFGDYSVIELIIGIVLVAIGVELILVSAALSFVIRVIFGLWIVLAGINRIVFSIPMMKYDKKAAFIFLITSLFIIALGILIFSGLLDKFIGLLIIIYAIIEVVDYIYFKVTDKDYGSSLEVQKVPKGKKSKEGKVVDAVIEEEKEKD